MQIKKGKNKQSSSKFIEIKINLSDLKSIKKAENLKLQLENKGWELIQSYSSFLYSFLVYLENKK